MPSWLGPAIGAAGSLLGGIFGGNSQRKANEANIAHQREFAQKGIQWKVADAKAAGVHPLYALGAQTHSFAPSSVGSTAMADGISLAGQHLGRAADSQSTQSQRLTKFNSQVQALTLQRMGLENEVLGAQLATTRGAMQNPAMPSPDGSRAIPGQGDAFVENLPMQRDMTRPGSPHREAKAVSSVGYTRTADGGYFPVMSKDAKDRLEEDIIGSVLWNVNNRLLPTFGFNQSPPTDHRYEYRPITQDYKRKKRSKRRSDYSKSIRW